MVNPHNLVPWRDEMSDGCSGAPWLSAIPAARAVCVQHDRRYYYGGTKAERLAADNEFRDGLIAAGVPRWRAVLDYNLVRVGGSPIFRRAGVSWSFGGSIFRYTDDPITGTAK